MEFGEDLKKTMPIELLGGGGGGGGGERLYIKHE